MAASGERSGTTGGTSESAAKPHELLERKERRHEEAVTSSEAHYVVHALRPYGILHRDALERLCGAEKWHDGSFESAVRAAVKSGEIEELPSGFLRAPGYDSK